LLEHAFDTLPIWGVTSSVFIDNPASRRVQEKLGFAVSGLKETFSRPRGAAVQALTTRLSAATWRARNGLLEQTAA
jgi:RimJ/RimL family protein N-acetyltransferase